MKHGKSFDYSRVNYTTKSAKVEIGCLVEDHGFFKQTPDNHMQGQGCVKSVVIAQRSLEQSTYSLVTTLLR
jgi:hypothetical protein